MSRVIPRDESSLDFLRVYVDFVRVYARTVIRCGGGVTARQCQNLGRLGLLSSLSGVPETCVSNEVELKSVGRTNFSCAIAHLKEVETTAEPIARRNHTFHARAFTAHAPWSQRLKLDLIKILAVFCRDICGRGPKHERRPAGADVIAEVVNLRSFEPLICDQGMSKPMAVHGAANYYRAATTIP